MPKGLLPRVMYHQVYQYTKKRLEISAKTTVRYEGVVDICHGLIVFEPYGRYKATWKGELQLPWREAGPPNHLDDTVDLDQ